MILEFPRAGYRLNLPPQVIVSGNNISIEISFSPPSGPSAEVLTSLRASATIGALPAGAYRVMFSLSQGGLQPVHSVSDYLPVQNGEALRLVSAASFFPSVAPGSIVTAFGRLLSSLSAADGTLPLALAGTTVSVRDSAGVERLAALMYVSPGQINLILPNSTAPGKALATAKSNTGGMTMGVVAVQSVAPGLFAANNTGTGAAAALALRQRSGEIEHVQVFECETPEGCKPTPIEFRPGDTLYFVLFGTGIRAGGSSTVRATLGSVPVDVTYAGPQPTFSGLDQVNVRLPPDFNRRGELDFGLTIGGFSANTVQFNLR